MDAKNFAGKMRKGDEIFGNLKNLGILALVVVGIIVVLSGGVNAVTLYGYVKDTDNNPVSDVTITYKKSSTSTWNTCDTTDSSGYFSCEVDANTDYTVRREHSCYVAVNSIGNYVGTNNKNLGTLIMYNYFYGYVKDANGNAVSGATVKYKKEGTTQWNNCEGVTSSSGYFWCRTKAGYNFQIEVVHADYDKVTTPLFYFEACTKKNYGTITLTEESNQVTLYGYVKDTDNNPVSDGTITYKKSGTSTWNTCDTTDSSGYFSCEVDANTDYTVRREHSCYETVNSIGNYVGTNNKNLGTLIMYNYFYGYVKDANGNAISGATVKYKKEGTTQWNDCYGKTDSNGYFWCRTKGGYNFQIEVVRTGYDIVTTSLFYFEACTRKNYGVITLTEESNQVTLDGYVKDTDNNPLSDVTITYKKSGTSTWNTCDTTDSSGYFSCEVDANTEYTVRREHSCYESVNSIQNYVGTDDKNLGTLIMYNYFYGYIKDANGNAISGATVKYKKEGTTQWNDCYGKTDSNGYFWCRTKGGYNFQIEVVRTGYDIVTTSLFYFEACTRKNYGVITLTEESNQVTLDGYVKDTDNNPLSDVTITYKKSGTSTWNTCDTTDSSGYFSCEVDANTEYNVRREHSCYESVNSIQNYVGTDDKNLGTLIMYNYFYGYIKDANGNAISGATVKYKKEGTTQWNDCYGKTDSNGYFWCRTKGGYNFQIEVVHAAYDILTTAPFYFEACTRKNYGTITLGETSNKTGYYGYVKTVDGNVISGATVKYGDQSTNTWQLCNTTDSLGYFSCEVDSIVEYDLLVQHTCHIDHTYGNKAVGNLGDLTLHNTISGYLEDVEGNAVSGASVYYKKQEGNWQSCQVSTDQNLRSNFYCSVESGGEFQIKVEHVDYDTLYSSHVVDACTNENLGKVTLGAEGSECGIMTEKFKFDNLYYGGNKYSVVLVFDKSKYPDESTINNDPYYLFENALKYVVYDGNGKVVTDADESRDVAYLLTTWALMQSAEKRSPQFKDLITEQKQYGVIYFMSWDYDTHAWRFEDVVKSYELSNPIGLAYWGTQGVSYLSGAVPIGLLFEVIGDAKDDFVSVIITAEGIDKMVNSAEALEKIKSLSEVMIDASTDPNFGKNEYEIQVKDCFRDYGVAGDYDDLGVWSVGISDKLENIAPEYKADFINCVYESKNPGKELYDTEKEIIAGAVLTTTTSALSSFAIYGGTAYVVSGMSLGTASMIGGSAALSSALWTVPTMMAATLVIHECILIKDISHSHEIKRKLVNENFDFASEGFKESEELLINNPYIATNSYSTLDLNTVGGIYGGHFTLRDLEIGYENSEIVIHKTFSGLIGNVGGNEDKIKSSEDRIKYIIDEEKQTMIDFDINIRKMVKYKLDRDICSNAEGGIIADIINNLWSDLSKEVQTPEKISKLLSTCGDGACDNAETYEICPEDCPTSTSVCGDNLCNNGETCSDCSEDCGRCIPVCGDDKCNGDEDCATCPTDCGECPYDPCDGVNCGSNSFCYEGQCYCKSGYKDCDRSQSNGCEYSGSDCPVCSSGQTKSCWYGSCKGTTTCSGGDWGSCVKNDLCCGISCSAGQTCQNGQCVNVGCTEGQTKQCTSTEGCLGTQTCSGNNWGNCVRDDSCCGVTECTSGDGCCPTNCNSTNDNDCPTNCGNTFCESDETCETCPDDCGCSSGEICCSGNCTSFVCSSDSDCNDVNSSTTDTCNNAGTCSAACSNTPICIINCTGKECGDNGCGGTCGTCSTDYNCVSGTCQLISGDCTCTTCDECETKLNDNSCSVVKLTADINSQSGNCIHNPSGFNNKVFDCQEHTIEGDGSGYGIYLYGKQNNTLKNCIITDFLFGIFLQSSSNKNTILNNNINSNEYGIYLDDSSNNLLTNNTVTLNKRGILLHLGASNNTVNSNNICSNTETDIQNNHISNYGNSGHNNTCDNTWVWGGAGIISCAYSCQQNCYTNTASICIINAGENCACINQALNDTNCNEVRMQSDITNHTGTCIDNPSDFNNKVFDCKGHEINGADSGNGHGIYLNGKSGNTIKNCVVTGLNYGIYLYNSLDNTLTNNTANSNRYGIYVYYSPNNTLMNNIVSNIWDGIYLDSSNNNLLKSNTASSNYDGIYLSSSSNNNILTSNTANSNSHNGIYVSSSNNNLTSNTVNSNHWAGIYISSSNNNLTSNTANNNLLFGIYLYSSSNNNLINNIVDSNSRYGIDLVFSSNNNNLINNTANSNNYYGILLSSSSSNNLINNTANSNNYNGIYLYSSSDNTINNNTISSNKNGVYIYLNSNFNKISNNKILNNTETGITTSNCHYFGGMCYGGNSNNIIEENEILNNSIGIFSQNSNSTINNNYVCGNILLNFNSTNWQSTYGYSNTCNNSNGWNDSGIEKGCRYRCNGINCDADDDYYVNSSICGGSDCDDNKASINPDTKWYVDNDNDTYGNATNYTIGCIKPTGNYVSYGLGLDCDDNDANITHQCCTQYDFDNNAAVDIFDVVAGLEHLSEGKEIYNQGCTARDHNEIDLFDLLTLIDKIGTNQI